MFQGIEKRRRLRGGRGVLIWSAGGRDRAASERVAGSRSSKRACPAENGAGGGRALVLPCARAWAGASGWPSRSPLPRPLPLPLSLSPTPFLFFYQGLGIGVAFTGRDGAHLGAFITGLCVCVCEREAGTARTRKSLSSCLRLRLRLCL
jgi:hypothetical protein